MFGLKNLGKKIKSLFTKPVNQELIDELEELFFESDLGSDLCLHLTDKVRDLVKKDPSIGTQTLLSEIKNQLLAELTIHPPVKENALLKVYLIVGTNGNGKTTSAAKLAAHLKSEGKNPLLVAADTFRAAAIDQLELWASKLGIDLVKSKPFSDPAAVCFDALKRAEARGHQAVIIDTAGRLHTKTNLMQELQKIYRSINKASEGALIETLLCLDATHGQNSLNQALSFHESVPLSGLILTKTDGTAKGAAAIALQKKLRVPIRYLGTGEQVGDFKPFNPIEFVESIF